MDNLSQQPDQVFKTPVLLVIFNRPNHTQQVMDTLREAKPPRLYISADGPREGREADIELCARTRAIATNVDWDCEVKTLFHEKNLGCGLAPATGITWFFDNEEEGIILEDDIVPLPCFYPFCQELLERYRHDTRVMEVTGCNLLGDFVNDADYDYFFSEFGGTWGWASWRRAWKLYDFTIPKYKEYFDKGHTKPIYVSDEMGYIQDKLRRAYEKDPTITWWDYQWSFTRRMNSGLVLTPTRNMIKNIGDGEESTHTGNMPDWFYKMTLDEVKFPLRHPVFIKQDNIADNYYFDYLFRFSAVEKLKHTVKGFIPEPILAKLGKSGA
jgi:hypothetical protein